MEYFDSVGIWYLPEEPSKEVSGTLRYSEEGILLSLMGSFSESWFFGSEHFPVIHGEVNRSPYGKYVTLYNSYMKSRSMGTSRTATEVIFSNLAIIGDSHLPLASDDFGTVQISITDLRDWLGWRGIQQQTFAKGSTNEFSVAYKLPKAIEIELDGKSLTLGYSWHSSESLHEYKLWENAHFFVEHIQALTVHDLLSMYVRPLQDLVTLATNTPNGVEEIRFTGTVPEGADEESKKFPPHYNLIYKPIYRSDKARIRSREMLFEYHEATKAGVEIIPQWFEFAKKYKEFCIVYFSYLYAPPAFLENKFQRVTTALSLLLTAKYGATKRGELAVAAIKDSLSRHYSEEELQVVAPALPAVSDLEFPLRFFEVLDDKRDILEPYVAGDLKAFGLNVLNTMAYVANRHVGTKNFEGDDLFYAIDRLNVLIKALVLEELGFPAPWIRGHAGRAATPRISG